MTEYSNLSGSEPKSWEKNWAVISHFIRYLVTITLSATNFEIQHIENLRKAGNFVTFGTVIVYMVASCLIMFVPYLLIGLTKAQDSHFIRFHLRQSVNFFITPLISLFLWYVMVLFFANVLGWLIYIPLITGVLFYLIWPIRAAIMASRGEYYSYPYCISFFNPGEPPSIWEE